MNRSDSKVLRNLTSREIEGVSGGYIQPGIGSLILPEGSIGSPIFRGEFLGVINGGDRVTAELEARRLLAFRRANPDLTAGQAYADFYNL